MPNQLNYGSKIQPPYIRTRPERLDDADRSLVQFPAPSTVIFGTHPKENVELCRERLLCGCTDPLVIELVNRRIIMGDSLNPNRRLENQSIEDHILMKTYFGIPNIIDWCI
jgi:hypothetical protein